MKTIYILVTSFLVFASSCKEHSTEVTTNDVMNTKSADGSSNTALPDMKFEEETHDFGRITQGLDILKKIAEVGAYKVEADGKAYYAPDGFPIQLVVIEKATAK